VNPSSGERRTAGRRRSADPVVGQAGGARSCDLPRSVRSSGRACSRSAIALAADGTFDIGSPHAYSLCTSKVPGMCSDHEQAVRRAASVGDRESVDVGMGSVAVRLFGREHLVPAKPGVRADAGQRRVAGVPKADHREIRGEPVPAISTTPLSTSRTATRRWPIRRVRMCRWPTCDTARRPCDAGRAESYGPSSERLAEGDPIGVPGTTVRAKPARPYPADGH
jgi:hypothetical protein